jgi:hypothetical protein
VKKTILAVIAVVLLVMRVSGEDTEIHVSGIMISQDQRVAIVNGKLRHSGDEFAGGRITAIGKTSITFLRDGVSKEYPVEIKKRVAQADTSSEVTAAPVKKSKKRVVINWLVSVKDKFKTGFARLKWRRAKKTPVVKAAPALELPKNAEKLALKEKMEWADKVLAEQDKRTAAIVTNDFMQCSSADEFSKIIGRYSEELQQGTAKVNKLGLPAIETSEDQEYIKWSQEHHRRSQEMVETRGEEIKKEAERLGVNMSVSVQFR